MWAVSISELGAFSSKLVLEMLPRNCSSRREGLFLEPFTEPARFPSSATINYRSKYKETDLA